MRTPSLLLVVTLLAAAAVSLHSAADDTAAELLGPAKTTQLRFFLHDTLSGKDPSAVFVARGAGRTPKADDPVPFSSIYATDDVLTEGPERESKVVGNAQGIYVSTLDGEAPAVARPRHGLRAHRGAFNGSAFVVYSRNTVVEHPVGRELAVVGGRGKFRMARGYALLRTHYLDNNNGDAIIEYNVTLVHH